MKRNLICMLVASMFAAPLFAQSAPPAGDSQAFLAFTGGSVWNDTLTGGTCIWYFPVLGNLPLTSLFASEKGSPVVDLNHADFVWVSGWSIQWEAENPGFGNSKVTLAGIPAATATIYYRQDPMSLPFDSRFPMVGPGSCRRPELIVRRGALLRDLGTTVGDMDAHHRRLDAIDDVGKRQRRAPEGRLHAIGL